MKFGKTKPHWPMVMVLTTAAMVVTAGEPEFEMTRSTVDGGGTILSTGRPYESKEAKRWKRR